MTFVLGVDGCKGGWCGVAIKIDGNDVHPAQPVVYPTFQQVLDTGAGVICVDVPIGLLDGPGQRTCDVEARRLLGKPRSSSVFPSPCRSVLSRDLSHENYKAVSEANRVRTGKKLTKQSFAIAPKILEVDLVMTPGLQTRVREVHPELCFWALSRQWPMKHNKKRVAGRQERWKALRRLWPSLPREQRLPIGIEGKCGIDDYTDALIAAWTAVCVAFGDAKPIPMAPELDAQGLRMEDVVPIGVEAPWLSRHRPGRGRGGRHR